MKELRFARQLLRWVTEEKREDFKFVFLNRIFVALEIAKKKIDKEKLVHEELEGWAKKEIQELKTHFKMLKY